MSLRLSSHQRNARKRQCVMGHPYTGDNVIVWEQRKWLNKAQTWKTYRVRVCRTCRRVDHKMQRRCWRARKAA